MKSEHEIQNELNNISAILADTSRSMPFKVPPGYFESFPAEVSGTIQNMGISDELPVWGKKMPYAVPDQFFSELTNNIVASAKLADLKTNIVWSAPDGYFESLPEQLLIAAKATGSIVKETRIIPLRRKITILPKRWAAAAIILITIGLGGFEFFFSQNRTEKILASVPTSEIQDYLQNNYRLDVDRVIGGSDISNLHLDNNEIVEYLNESGWD